MMDRNIFVLHCIICNQEFDFDNIFKADFLWNDGLWWGRPICKGCVGLFKDHPHLNYEKKEKKKKLGMEKWL